MVLRFKKKKNASADSYSFFLAEENTMEDIEDERTHKEKLAALTYTPELT